MFLAFVPSFLSLLPKELLSWHLNQLIAAQKSNKSKKCWSGKELNWRVAQFSAYWFIFFLQFFFCYFQVPGSTLSWECFLLFKATSEHSPSVPVPHKKGDFAIGWEPGRKYQGRLAEKLWLCFTGDANITPRLIEQLSTKINMPFSVENVRE